MTKKVCFLGWIHVKKANMGSAKACRHVILFPFFGSPNAYRVICQFCQRMQACDSFSILWECRCISLWFVICDKIQRQLYFLPFAYPKCRSSTTIFMWWEEVFISSTMTTTMNLKRKNESRRIKWSREGGRTEEEETNEKRKWENRLLS